MQQQQFPMILTHRENAHAQIVVANAEQLADVPEEFLPAVAADVVTAVTAAAAIPGVSLDASLADLDAQRAEFSRTVDEFTAHVQTETEQLAAMRAQIDSDRSDLEELRAQLEQDRATFETQRASTAAGTGETAGETGAASAIAEGAATGDAATPAKRTRAAKEGA
jgi:TolA-binding protein